MYSHLTNQLEALAQLNTLVEGATIVDLQGNKQTKQIEALCSHYLLTCQHRCCEKGPTACFLISHPSNIRLVQISICLSITALRPKSG